MRCGNTELAARWPLSGQGTRRWGGRWGLKVKQVSALGADPAQFPQPQNLSSSKIVFQKTKTKNTSAPAWPFLELLTFVNKTKADFQIFCSSNFFHLELFSHVLCVKFNKTMLCYN